MSTSFEISLEKLPDVTFAEKRTEVIVAELIADIERTAGRRLYPSDPVRLLVLAFAKYAALQRNKIDDSAKQNLLKYSREGNLENISALPGVWRSEASFASTTLKFTISEARSHAMTIPAGTRATPGDRIYFATTEDAEIPIGALSVETAAKCSISGEIGNGFYPGQINILCDPFPYSDGVENVTISQGGAEKESLDSLRQRVAIAPESFSSAGPGGAYVFFAKTASQLINDVSVVSPSPGVVEIIPLLRDGEMPTQPLLDDVYAECSDDTRRPLTDYVVVRAPEVVKYKLNFTYFISRKDAAIGLNIQSKVTESVEKYILWQKSALGKDVNPSKLTEMIMGTGVKRIEVSEPSYRVLEYYEIAVVDMEDVNPVYGGLEDD